MTGRYGPPPEYASPGSRHDRLIDLMMRRGQIDADAERSRGEGTANLIGGLTQLAGGAVQQYGAQQEVKNKAAKMAKRDAAWVSYVEGGEWQKDPKSALATSLKIWGPEQGPKQFEGLAATQKIGQGNPAEDGKSLGAIITALGPMGDEARARWWPQARQLALKAYPDAPIPEQYDPQKWPEFAAIGQKLSGEKPAGTREVKVRNPDGSESIKIVADQAGQEFASAPEQRAPNLQHVETAEGIRTFNPQTGEMGPVIGKGKPPQESSARQWVFRDGNPVRVSESQIRPGDLPGNTREQGRPVTSGDAGRITDLDTSLDDLKVLGGTLSGNKATGTSARAGAMLPNAVTEMTGWGTEAKQKQATIDRVKQVIGKALEGGVLRKEDEAKYEKILPTIGDTPALVRSKLAGLEQALTLRRQRQLESLADAGYDTSKFDARGGPQAPPPRPGGAAGPRQIKSDADYDSLPSGAHFIDPDGNSRVKP